MVGRKAPYDYWARKKRWEAREKKLQHQPHIYLCPACGEKEFTLQTSASSVILACICGVGATIQRKEGYIEDQYYREYLDGFYQANGTPHTLQVWLRIPYRQYDLARLYFKKWGVRYEARHGTYRFRVKGGTLLTRSQQRIPPILGVRTSLEEANTIEERLREKGIWAKVLGGTFLGERRPIDIRP